MPLFVGSGTTSGGGFEAQSSQAGIPTSTSDPQNANVGDVYVQRVGTGATMKLYDGSSWNQVGGAQNIVPNISGGDPYATADGIYEIRAFESPGTLTVSTRCVDAEAIIIGGGGGGGRGGGGAGGGIATSFTLAPGSYPIVVGYGGTASSTSAVPNTVKGCPGGDTTFNGFTAIGGGGGGASNPADPACPGGSGGGGVLWPGTPCLGGCGVCGQGNPGGNVDGGGGGYKTAGQPGPGAPGPAGARAGSSGSFKWGLPPSHPGTDSYGLTQFSGGGGGSPRIPGGGSFGTGGPTAGDPISNGCCGAVFIRFKKCQ